jgi:hypothetical protein
MSDEELRETQRRAALEVKALTREKRKWKARTAAEDTLIPPSGDEHGKE